MMRRFLARSLRVAAAVIGAVIALLMLTCWLSLYVLCVTGLIVWLAFKTPMMVWNAAAGKGRR